MRYLVGLVLALALSASGCSESEGAPPDDSPYASKDLWLCRPDIEDDYCDTADLSTTEIQPDGTMEVLDEIAPNPDAEVDCFYVYPTVNYDPEPGNTETLVPPPEETVEVVAWQAAQYRGTCRLYAPLYHQMSNITYLAYIYHVQESEYFQRAYADVAEAFDYYLRNHNEGRAFILIGHSQGSHILTELLRDRFDDDEDLRAQLVSAVLTGPTGTVQVPEGERIGGSFANVPLCSSASDTGCVIAFDANYPEPGVFLGVGAQVTPPMTRGCVNPASFDDSLATLAAFVYPRSSWTLAPTFPNRVQTEWVRYSGIYTGRCSEENHTLEIELAVDYEGDVPMTPKEIQDLYVASGSRRYLHGVETYIASTDFLRIVEQQIANRQQ